MGWVYMQYLLGAPGRLSACVSILNRRQSLVSWRRNISSKRIHLVVDSGEEERRDEQLQQVGSHANALESNWPILLQMWHKFCTGGSCDPILGGTGQGISVKPLSNLWGGGMIEEITWMCKVTKFLDVFFCSSETILSKMSISPIPESWLRRHSIARELNTKRYKGVNYQLIKRISFETCSLIFAEIQTVRASTPSRQSHTRSNITRMSKCIESISLNQLNITD